MIGNPEQERHTMPSGALGLVAVSDTSWLSRSCEASSVVPSIFCFSICLVVGMKTYA